MIEIDGTDNKGALGANAILGASLAVREGRCRIRRAAAVQVRGRRERPCAAHAHDEHPERRRACRQQRGLPGVHDHAGGRSPRSPRRCAGASRSTTRSRRSCTTRASAAAWATRAASPPTSPRTRSRWNTSCKACEAAGYTPGTDIMFAMDPASTRILRCRQAEVRAGQAKAATLTSAEMVDYWEALVDKYPIISLEDGMAEEDWDGWKELTDRIGDRVQLVGDDLFVTNSKRLRQGHRDGLRERHPHQGEPDRQPDRDAARPSRWRKQAGYACVMSHRSGETEDTTIADLAVACNTGQIKTGAPCRTRPRGEVQPAAAHRGGAGHPGHLRRHVGVLQH